MLRHCTNAVTYPSHVSEVKFGELDSCWPYTSGDKAGRLPVPLSCKPQIWEGSREGAPCPRIQKKNLKSFSRLCPSTYKSLYGMTHRDPGMTWRKNCLTNSIGSGHSPRRNCDNSGRLHGRSKMPSALPRQWGGQDCRAS